MDAFYTLLFLFRGTYHLVVTTMLNDTLKLQNGVCAPSTCTKVEVAGIYGNIRRHYLLLTKNSNSSPSEFLWTEDDRDDKKMLDNADRAFMWIIFFRSRLEYQKIHCVFISKRSFSEYFWQFGVHFCCAEQLWNTGYMLWKQNVKTVRLFQI